MNGNPCFSHTLLPPSATLYFLKYLLHVSLKAAAPGARGNFIKTLSILGQQVNSIRSYTDTCHPSLITSIYLCRALGESYLFVAISKIYVFLHVSSDTRHHWVFLTCLGWLFLFCFFVLSTDMKAIQKP